MNDNDVYTEALRYIDNAKEVLSSKAGKDGDYYSDRKYVKMASHTAYCGLLYALDGMFEYKGIEKPKNRSRKRDAVTVKFYQEQLGKINRTVLDKFNETVYPNLHELGGYEGVLDVNTIQRGISTAVELIDWVKKQISKS